jgi:hypothetical protein
MSYREIIDYVESLLDELDNAEKDLYLANRDLYKPEPPPDNRKAVRRAKFMRLLAGFYLQTKKYKPPE